MENKYHETVMKAEAVSGLNVQKDALFIDATLGNGGHTEEILKLGGKVIAIEADPEMLKLAEERLNSYGDKVSFVHGNFKDLDSIAQEQKIDKIDGILFDLGVTNLHLKNLERGFSFENPEAQLDMRLDPETQGVTAADLLNILREDQLRVLFESVLNPGAAKWIAGRVMFARADAPIKTVGEMLEISTGLRTGKTGLNEATLPFLALRIAVNSELENLKEALPKAFNLLRGGGRLVVISFHSGEDKIAKEFFKEKESEGSKIITFKPMLAGEEELSRNRRARSAKLRILEK